MHRHCIFLEKGKKLQVTIASALGSLLEDMHL